MPKDGRGWHRESARHGLAARGIKTGRKQARKPSTKRRKTVSVTGKIARLNDRVWHAPSSTLYRRGLKKGDKLDVYLKRVKIRDTPPARELAEGIKQWHRKPDISMEEAFQQPTFVAGSVADQLATATERFAKLEPSKTTYFEHFSGVGGRTFYAYLHADGSFVIRKETKAGNPPGRGS